MTTTINTTTHLETFPFIDLTNSLVTGKVNANWSKIVTRNGVTSAVAVTVSEVSGQSGYYSASLTPDAVGSWTVVLSVDHSGYTYRFIESFAVVTAQQADPAAYIAAGDIEMVSPVAASGDVTLYQSDTYDADDSRSLDWSTTDAGTWPALTSATISLVIRHAITADSLTASGSVTTPTGSTKAVRVELTASQTASLDPGVYTYQVIATLSGGNVVTLATGALTVIARLS